MRLARPALALLIPLLAPLTASGAPEGPPYYDPDRNLEKQDEAAKVARATAGQTSDPAEVLRLFVDPSAQVRDAVFGALVQRNDARLLQALSSQLRHRDEFISATIAELFGQCKFAGGREDLEKYGLAAGELTALEAIWALEALDDPASAEALERAHKRRREHRVKGDALVALAAVAPDRARPLITEALADREPPLRIAGLVALGRIDPAAAAAAAVDVVAASPMRGQKAWEARVLFAALEALSSWRDRSSQRELAVRAIDALIARMEREEGLAHHEVGIALQDLTGQAGMADDVAIWRGWWEARKGSFQPEDKPEPAAREEGTPRPETGGGGTRVRFHGIPIYSKRMVFTQDISGGSNNPIDKNDPASPTKMKFSKDELIRVLEGLTDDCAVNILFFATAYYKPADQLLPLGRARRQLIEFVRAQETPNFREASQRAMGRSNLYDVLHFAMQDPEIDTIYFLTEGTPNEGRYVDADRFMRHLLLLNRYQRVQIHCLQMANSNPLERFLRRVAGTGGGSYYDLDVILRARQAAGGGR